MIPYFRKAKTCKRCKQDFIPEKLGFFKSLLYRSPLEIIVLVVLLSLVLSEFLGKYGEALTKAVWGIALILALPALGLMYYQGFKDHYPVCDSCIQRNLDKINKEKGEP